MYSNVDIYESIKNIYWMLPFLSCEDIGTSKVDHFDYVFGSDRVQVKEFC